MRYVQIAVAVVGGLATVAVTILTLSQDCGKAPAPSAPPSPRVPVGSATVVDARVAPAERPDTPLHVRVVIAAAKPTNRIYVATARCGPDEQLTGGGCTSTHKPDSYAIGDKYRLGEGESAFGAAWQCEDTDAYFDAQAFCVSFKP